jgi:hypothetical protein
MVRIAASSLLFGAVVVALAGCPGSTPGPAGSGPDAGSSGSESEVDAGAMAAAEPAPADLQLTVRYLASDGGLTPIDFGDGGSRPVIEPTTRLEIGTNLALQNYRVRLFDEVERAMVSDDEAEDLGDRTLYRIQLLSPLKTGHRYSLVLDAQTGSAVADALGRTHPDQRLEIMVAGEKLPEKPARKVRPPSTRSKSKPPATRRQR